MNKDFLENICPLSPMQQGMLFHTLYSPDAGVYVQQFTCTLHGAIQIEALKQAWQHTVSRHAALRTVFIWENRKEPVQVVYRRARMPIQELDWRDLPPAEQQAQLQEFYEADYRQGFDLTKAPLLRLTLIRLADTAYHLVWSHHHLLVDGWCLVLILKDVLEAYTELAAGREPVAEPSRPFSDYIAWLLRQDVAQSERFWRETLRSFDAPTPLGVDRDAERVAEQAERYAEEYLFLSPESSAALNAFVSRRKLTLSALFQGAWALLLSQYSGAQDVVFGITVSGRPPELTGVEAMVGNFINTLPVRVAIPDAGEVGPWLEQIQRQQVQRQKYSYSPLVEIQSWSDVPRGTRLFESILVLGNYPTDASLQALTGSVDIRDVNLLERTGYPLTVGVEPGAEIALKINYDQRRFDAATIRRMLQHFRQLLIGLVAEPAQPLRALSLLTDEERTQLLHTWNATERAYPATESFMQLFAAQAARTPDVIAVRCGDEQATYRELARRATTIATQLVQRGVGSEVVVGLLAERSIDFLVAVLAIFKAGGAYLPLDPLYPASRLQHVIVHSRTPLVLTARALEPLLETALIDLDADRPAIASIEMLEQATGVPLDDTAASMPHNLVYVIYTSGSTGVPKGVMVEQRGMVNHLYAKIAELGLTAADVVVQNASQSFDISVWQFLAALLVGGQVVIVSDVIAHDPTQLLATLEAREVTILEVVPSLLRAMLAEASAEGAPRYGLSALRWLVPTGEEVPADLCRTWLDLYPQIPLLNAYGPTECSDDVTHHPIAVPPVEQRVPIGRPVANTRLYILDYQMRPLPVGVSGELYVGGDGVGRGYLDDARRTALAFVPDPFASNPGSRLYRTGDLGRYQADGTIAFGGRIDSQVKIRGFRIELGEIEATLREHEAVGEAAVIVREETGGARLVAYVVGENLERRTQNLEDSPEPGSRSPGGHPVLGSEGLRTFLAKRLPEYMVPAAFVTLDALPLTPNGKLDRKALPAPEFDQAAGDATFVVPQTPIQELVAASWKEVLGLTQLGIHDNFFARGGHSLLATQLVSRLRKTFQIELPLRSIFESPTVAELAQQIEHALVSGAERALPPLEPIARRPGVELPLSFAQQRLWFLNQLTPNSAFYNITLAVRLTGALDVAALRQSFNTMVERHEALRTSFSLSDRRPVQTIHAQLTLDVPLIDLSETPAAEREAYALQLATEDARRPFDLSQAPLMRIKLLRLQPDEHLVVLTMHHIITDAWSFRVLMRELAALYTATVNDEPRALPPLPIQYADFASWQRQWLQGQLLESYAAVWQQRLSGPLPVLELPTDRPRSELQTFHGALESRVLSPELTQQLHSLSQRAGCTLFMTLLAAFDVLLHFYTGQRDVIVGSDVANRNRAETEGLIGFFVNQLVLRTSLDNNPSFTELLRRVRDVALEAYAYQDLPFDKLVELLNPERSLKYAPLFQVKLVLQNVPEQQYELPGLTVTSIEVDRGTSQLDLNLRIMQARDELVLSAEYSTDLFDAATIAHLLELYETLLGAVVAQPELALEQLVAIVAEADQRYRQAQAQAAQDAGLHKLRSIKRKAAR